MKLAEIIFLLVAVFSISVYSDVEVWLTISSLVLNIKGEYKQRLIKLNWRNAENDTNDWIGLFTSEVRDTVRLSDALVVIQADQRDGNYRTDIEFPVHIFNEADVERKCLGFFVVYARNNYVLAKNCIKLNPNWMEENFDLVRDRRITDLMIPGTHNSAAYYEGYRDTGAIQGFVDNYAICQDENVFNQLMYGIRYIDLRVMFDNNVQKGRMRWLWMAHDKFRMNNTLVTILEDIRKFMDITSKEVVFVDFHRFSDGFDKNKALKHKMVLNQIEKYLGPHLSTKRYYDVTIGELVNSAKRVIVGYAEDDIDRPQFLYPRVIQLWADTDNIDRLHEYFSENICNKMYPYMTKAAMAELTPQKAGVIVNSYGGLRTLADNVNGYVTKWFRDEWATCANIIATDFFLGNNIIEVSINNLKQRR